MDAIYVGIDVCKQWLDVHVVPSGDSFRVGVCKEQDPQAPRSGGG